VILVAHTVKLKTKTDMRTKIFLAASAAMAAGIVASNAQVYSANIVGYVNYISSTSSPKFEMIANPLDNGSNTIASVFASPPGGTSLQLWNGAGFTGYTYSPKLGGWGANGSVLIPPGVGFFISVGGSGVYSNTFVGQVDPQTGLKVTNVIGTGFQALASMVPYSDSVSNTATVNLTVPGGTVLQEWNNTSQAFVGYTYSPKLGGWQPSVPVINAGQGVFIQNNTASPVNWVQTGP
jgi:hypothetical protein